MSGDFGSGGKLQCHSPSDLPSIIQLSRMVANRLGYAQELINAESIGNANRVLLRDSVVVTRCKSRVVAFDVARLDESQYTVYACQCD